MDRKEFRPVVGFPEYLVSREGVILGARFGKPLRWGFRRGYPKVTLCPGRIDRSVHAIVSEAYLGPRPPGYHIAHLDGNRQNPHLDNLKYTTPEENEAHKLIHGTLPVGTDHHASKLSYDQVQEIRSCCIPKNRKCGMMHFAEKFGVDRHTVAAAYNGVSYPDRDTLGHSRASRHSLRNPVQAGYRSVGPRAPRP